LIHDMKIALLIVLAVVLLASAQAKRTPTTAAPPDDEGGSDSPYAAAVNALIDSGTCADIVTSDTCGDAADAESYYETYVYNGKRVIITSGSPNHAAEQNRGLLWGSHGYWNPNTRCSIWQFAVLPLNPTKSYYRESGMGTVGFVESGGVIFNHLSAPDGSLAMYYEEETLDSCYGHSTKSKQYHYHAIPTCVPKDTNLANDASQCYHLGYMLDGFPVYGRCAQDGVELKSCYVLTPGEDGDNFSDYYFDANADCDLDEANGYTFPDGSYGYILTENFATTPTGYYGSTIDSMTCGFTP